MSNTKNSCTPAQIEILKKQQFSDTEPGMLLKDFNSLLAFIGETGIAVSEKTQLFALNTLAELNQVLSHPLAVKLKRPLQKSFPHINGLYLLLRSSGLSHIVSDGKKTTLMLNEDVLAEWKKLSPTECYFSLLQAFVYRADGEIIGERPGCFEECLSFFQRDLGTGIDVNSKHDNLYLLRFRPGLHNLALMELFGFIDIKCVANEDETWPLDKIKPTAWGSAIFGYFAQNNRVMPFLGFKNRLDQADPEFWEIEFKKHIPAWKKSLIQVERKTTERGTYIFKVTLGKASCKLGVPAGLSLDGLACGILDAFKFDNDHLYEFIYKNQCGIKESIVHPFVDRGSDFCTEDCTVGYLPLYKGMTFIFHFDFGDDWEFKIQVEAMPSAELDFSDLTVIEKRGTPPEQYPDWDDE
ncbi:MAG: hypothetical protein PSV18_09150 [Methylobacter sp.]|nr:hypothetical protein [Candidatus Methylobacter titanis]